MPEASVAGALETLFASSLWVALAEAGADPGAEAGADPGASEMRGDALADTDVEIGALEIGALATEAAGEEGGTIGALEMGPDESGALFGVAPSAAEPLRLLTGGGGVLETRTARSFNEGRAREGLGWES